MKTDKSLVAALGGPERFTRLKTVYENAKPKRGRWGPGILTADEVFRRSAAEDGFSEEAIALFIDYVELQ